MTRSQDDVQRQLLERSLLSRLSRDGATVAAGQFAAAIGTLVGIRLLTEIAAPSTFGMVSLALGIAALGLNTASTPFTQAALHLYPQLESDGRLIDLRNALAHTYWRAGRVVGLVVAVGSAVLVTSDQVSWVLCALVTLLLAVDIMRSVSITFLNAARRHARFSAWLAGSDDSSDCWCLGGPSVRRLSGDSAGGLPCVVRAAPMGVLEQQSGAPWHPPEHAAEHGGVAGARLEVRVAANSTWRDRLDQRAR